MPDIPVLSALAFGLSQGSLSQGTEAPQALKTAQPSTHPDTQPDPSEALTGQPDLPTDPSTVLANLVARGHRVLTRDGRLFVDLASRLQPTDRPLLRQYKSDLLPLVDPWPVDERWPPADPWPPFARIGVTPRGTTLADFLGTSAIRSSQPEWCAQEPPSLDGIHDIVLNVESNGLHWRKGDRPIGITVGTLDGQLKRFLPFRFTGGNLDEATVKRWAERELRGKHITNANTRFDVHMLREWGIDLEAQDNTVSDVMHYSALLDDHRKKFGLDVLVKDFLNEEGPPRVDESQMASYHAADVAVRAEFQVEAVARLRDEMWPMLDAEGLQDVRQLEDEVIYPVCEMDRNGSSIDMALLDQMSAECTAMHGRLMTELSNECGFRFEYSASGWKRLFEYCHETPPESGSYAEEVIETFNHPLIKKAHRAGQYGSLNSKVFAPYKEHIGADGMLYYDINQLKSDKGGTVSGRFSIGYVQQVPNHDNHHEIFGEGDVDACGGTCPLFPRRLFVPKVGDYLDADAAQIEYRLFAHFANNPEVNAAYTADPWLSFHKKMWTMLKQHKPDMLYTHTKSFDFAKQYGARSIKLAVMMGFITAAEGEKIRAAKQWSDPRLDQIHEIEKAFKQAMPEGDYLLDRASHLAKAKCDSYCKAGDKLHQEFEHRGYVKTILGRRSRFPNNHKTYIGLNRVLQGSGADIVKRKIVELHRERKWTQFLMRLTVHDSVLGDAQQPETAGRVAEVLNRQSFPQLRVPILFSHGVGRNWADCK